MKKNDGYEYDGKGNVVYVNRRGRKKDGMGEEKRGEGKVKWDEEKGVVGCDDKGFVRKYW